MASKNKKYTSGLQFEGVAKLIGSSLKRIETKCGRIRGLRYQPESESHGLLPRVQLGWIQPRGQIALGRTRARYSCSVVLLRKL